MRGTAFCVLFEPLARAASPENSIPLSDHVHLAALRIAERAGGCIDEHTQMFLKTARTEFDPPAAQP
jgi:hypothetical protein